MHAETAKRAGELADFRRRRAARHEVFGSAARGAGFDPLTGIAGFLVEFMQICGRTELEQYFDFAHALRRTSGRSADGAESEAVRNPLMPAAAN